jgi:hypothetical protein
MANCGTSNSSRESQTHRQPRLQPPCVECVRDITKRIILCARIKVTSRHERHLLNAIPLHHQALQLPITSIHHTPPPPRPIVVIQMSLSPLIVTSPPPALAASRARRQRSNALSRARESEAEWDGADSLTSTTSTPTAPWRDDELICPLAALDTQRTHANPHAHAHAHANSNPTSWIPMPIWPSNEGELQAVLAQFAFPTSAPLGRKHRRSGEMIADNSPNSPAPPPSASSGKRHAASGPTKRASCPHCERGRSSA